MLRKIFIVFILGIVLLVTLLASLLYFRSNIIWAGYSENMQYKLEEVASGLGIPWSMDFIDQQHLIVTERSGNVGIVNLQTATYRIISQFADIFNFAECGLHDVKISPDFASNNLVYFTYAKNINGSGYTSLATARLVGEGLTDLKDIFISKHQAVDSGLHCGSRIAFDNEGHLFMSIGDRGARNEAQNNSNHIGTVIRLNLDGSIPSDNPFVTHNNYLPEIWSYGHRNPQGLAYDSSQGRLWSNEHGPLGGDEINLILPGRNYGWPVLSYGREYTGPEIGEGFEKPGMEKPLKIWTPSIAPSSLLIYSGSKLTGWSGNLLSTSLVQKHLNRLVIDSTGRVIYEERLLEDIHERFRAIVEDTEGNIYLSTDNGRILKISRLEEDASLIHSIFKHIDLPGIYLSFEINFAYW